MLCCLQITFPQAGKVFLSKVHQYIKDRMLDAKYACAFLFNINGSNPSEFDEVITLDLFGTVFSFIRAIHITLPWMVGISVFVNFMYYLNLQEKQNLADIIQIHHQAKARQLSMQSETNSTTAYPEYIVPYLVHALAHHSCPDVDECKDVKAYELVYRQAYLTISLIFIPGVYILEKTIS